MITKEMYPEIDPKGERIVGVAMRDTETGLWYSTPAPARHGDLIYDMIKVYHTSPPIDSFDEFNSGFITSLGRYVTRKRAAQIAFKSGQVTDKEFWDGALLTSEDLW